MAKWLSKISSLFLQRLHADKPLLVIILVYTVIGMIALYATGTTRAASYVPYLDNWIKLFMVLFPIVTIMVDAYLVRIRFKRRRGFALRRTFSSKRVAYLLAGTVLMMATWLFQGTFTSIKNAMFAWRGAFLYDKVQADIDTAMHFGVDPWHFVSGLITHPALRIVTEFSYSVVWFTLSFAILYFVATSPRAGKVRLRYFACFMLVWILVGNVFAALFLSSGPAFYGLVTGDFARFGELTQLLAMSPGAADYQAYLWSSHLTGTASLASGISAFPSIHVAMMAMNTLFAFEASRKLGYITGAYTLFIMASSVALGWHYAIDGYASIIIVWLCYAALKKLLPDTNHAAARMPDQNENFKPSAGLITS